MRPDPIHRTMSLIALCALCALPNAAIAGAPGPSTVSLEFRVLTPGPIVVGDQISVGLYAVSDHPTDSHPIAAIDAVFGWELGSLQLTGLTGAGGAALSFSGFPINGSGGLNESNPPQDGTGFYVAFAPLGSPVNATTAGTLITTFLFEALMIDDAAEVNLLPSGGSPLRTTIVYDGVIPNTDVTGSLLSTTALICTECLGDTNGDFTINFADLNNALGQFNMTGMGLSADVNCDGIVNFADLNLILSYYNLSCS